MVRVRTGTTFQSSDHVRGPETRNAVTEESRVTRPPLIRRVICDCGCGDGEVIAAAMHVAMYVEGEDENNTR